MDLGTTLLFMFMQYILPALYPNFVNFRFKGISDYGLKYNPKRMQRSLEASLQSRVAFGSPASIEEFPYFASLQHCGAVIISDRWVLTAAHCVDVEQSKGNHSLWVGGESVENSKEISYDKAVLHPWYFDIQNVLINDIALLRLTEPLQFGATIQPIELNEEDFDEDFYRYDEHDSDELHYYQDSNEHNYHEVISYTYYDDGSEPSFRERNNDHHLNDDTEEDEDYLASEHDTIVLVGRGLDETGQIPENITTIKMLYYPAEVCYAWNYGAYFWYEYLESYMPLINKMTLCGVSVEAMAGAGLGDSGSPVVKDNKLVGLVSYGMGDAGSVHHSSTVFLTKISSYIPWIKSVTGL